MKPRAGYALLLMLLILAGLSGATLLATLRARATTQALFSQRQTQRRLHEATHALLAHALIEDNTPGSLPSPSAPGALNGDSSPTGFTGMPGQAPRRLPWRFLALDRALDGDAECLWYAVDARFRNNLGTAQRSLQAGTALNPATSAQLLADGQPAAAVVVAPGSANTAQNRAAANAESCRDGPTDAFLDGNNASAAGSLASFPGNDRLQALRPPTLMRALAPRVLHALAASNFQELLQARAAATGERSLAALRGTRLSERAEFDAALASVAAAQLAYSGNCPGVRAADGSLSYRKPVSWLCFNDWYAQIQLIPGGLSLALDTTHSCTLDTASGRVRCPRS